MSSDVSWFDFARVLKPGGRFAMYDVTSVDKGALVFPVPWARTPEISFLLTQQEMHEFLRDAGFTEVSWIDRTAWGIKWFDEQQSVRPIGGALPSLGLHVVMGREFPTLAANLGRNLKEGALDLSRSSSRNQRATRYDCRTNLCRFSTAKLAVQCGSFEAVRWPHM